MLAADDGLLAADGAGNAVRYDILHLAVHLIMADALCGSGLHNGVRHRVGVMLLQTGGNAKDLVLCAGAERNDLHNGRGGMGQRAGLVKNDGVGVGQCLKIFAALDRDVVAAALPHRGQHRQRHRELQRTGEVYHQNRDSARCVAGKRIGDGSAQQAVGHQLIGQRCGAGLTGGFQLFGVLNHPDDLVIAAAASLLFNGQGNLALLHNGACIDNSTGRLAHRLGLAGQRGLIDAGLTVQHPAIQRNHAAGMHDDGIPGADLRNRDKDLALGGKLPDAIHIQRHAVCQIAQRFFAGPFLQQLTQPQQEHDRAGGGKVTPQHRYPDRQRVQHLDLQPAVQQAAQAVPKIAHTAYRSVGKAYRCRQKQLARKVEKRQIDELFLIFMVYGARAVGRYLSQGLHIKAESGCAVQYLSPGTGIGDDGVTGALIHNGSAHTGQPGKVSLQLVRLGHRQPRLVEMQADAPAALMQNVPFHYSDAPNNKKGFSVNGKSLCSNRPIKAEA